MSTSQFISITLSLFAVAILLIVLILHSSIA
jgi:hypothetical protein